MSRFYRIDRNRWRAGRVRVEVYLLRWEFGMSLGLADYETALSCSLKTWLFSLYLSFDSHWLYERLSRLTKRVDQRYSNGREIKVYWMDGGLWWTLWSDPMESRSADPWYVKMHVLRPMDVLFGRAKYSSETLKVERTVVPMPEGGYPATVTVNEDSWKRPRWPRPRKLTRCEVKPDTPIPFPGKGENAWDCGEDASHSLYGCFPDAFAATMGMAESVMRNRLKYGGGWNYRPEKQEGVNV